eukprot:10940786-Karenia_brevis.AAC.1
MELCDDNVVCNSSAQTKVEGARKVNSRSRKAKVQGALLLTCCERTLCGLGPKQLWLGRC